MNDIMYYGILRPDLLFTYWIDLWAIVYYVVFSFYKETNYTVLNLFLKFGNPLIVFLFSLIENLIALFYFLYHKENIKIILSFCVIIFTSKIIPILLLKNAPVHWFENFISGVFIFIIYNIYLHMNNTTLYKIYVKTLELVVKGKTPLMFLMNKLKI